MSPSDNLVETLLLTRQIRVNNNYVNSLMTTVDQVNRETTIASARLQDLNRANRSNTDSILFYLYTTGVDSITPTTPTTPHTMPTNAIIESETSMHIFNSIESPTNTECPISRETFEDQQSVMMINHCGHIFNSIGLLRWFQTRSTCPVCRYNICSREEYTETPVEETRPRESIFNILGNIGSNIVSQVNRPINTTDDILDLLRESNIISNIANQLREPR